MHETYKNPINVLQKLLRSWFLFLSLALWARFQYFTDSVYVNSEWHQQLIFHLSWTSNRPGHFYDRKRLKELSHRYTGAHRFHRFSRKDVSILTHMVLKCIVIKVPEIVPVTDSEGTWQQVFIKIVAECGHTEVVNFLKYKTKERTWGTEGWRNWRGAAVTPHWKNVSWGPLHGSALEGSWG